MDNVKICDSISCFILYEAVWRHISLDNVRHYAARNFPIWDNTAEVH